MKPTLSEYKCIKHSRQQYIVRKRYHSKPTAGMLGGGGGREGRGVENFATRRINIIANIATAIDSALCSCRLLIDICIFYLTLG